MTYARSIHGLLALFFALLIGVAHAQKADSPSFLSDEYLHPSKNLDTRVEKANPNNPYSAEIVDEPASDQCRVPPAFSEVHQNVQQEWNTPHRSYGYGKPITEAAIKPWNIDVTGDGKNLPPQGVGMTIEEGEVLYQQYCGQCHGEFAEGNGYYLPLAGGNITDLPDTGGPAPTKTLSNYWPYAISFFDYIRRAMPLFRPNHEKIGDAGYLGITGFILYTAGYTEGKNWQLEYDTFFDSTLLRKINREINNQKNFFCDPRPDIHQTRCGLNGTRCPESQIGDGKGNIHKYREALIDPATGKHQYNVKQRN